ncbi:MAG: restriction endonuclease subunit S [Bacteroidetes bacterium]|nr:restriction endonuclease subunit S [Bacteroidota bacterium]
MSTREMFIDKSSWTVTKFGDVAIQQKVNVNREDTTLTKYVKGEHMSSEDIHLRSWGELQDEYLGPAFIRYFEKGDILYGSRRTYLKKVSIAPFQGITSNTTFVIKAIEEKFDKRLLPFLMLSDGFTEHSIMHSKGSVNPYINWKDLANYEFLLPPKDQQAELAELLWAVNNSFERNLELKNSLSNYFERMKNDSISGKFSSNSNNWKEYIFGTLGYSYGGLTGKTKSDFGEGKPFINYMNVFSNAAVNPSQFDRVRIGTNEKQNEIKLGDILFTGSSEIPEEVGMASVVLDDLSGYYLNSFCFGFRLNDFEILRPEYAKYLMRSAFVRQFMTRRAQGSTRFNISKSVVKEKLNIVIPEIKEQLEIAATLDSIESSLMLLDQKISESKTLQKSILNQIF